MLRLSLDVSSDSPLLWSALPVCMLCLSLVVSSDFLLLWSDLPVCMLRLSLVFAFEWVWLFFGSLQHRLDHLKVFFSPGLYFFLCSLICLHSTLGPFDDYVFIYFIAVCSLSLKDLAVFYITLLAFIKRLSVFWWHIKITQPGQWYGRANAQHAENGIRTHHTDYKCYTVWRQVTLIMISSHC